MRVKVKQIHEQWRPVRGALRAAAPSYQGVLSLAETRSEELHRSLRIARLVVELQ